MDTKTVCLAILSMGEASGYDITKRIEEVFSRFLEVSPSGIYGALKALDREGLASARTIPQDGKPNKVVYSILEPGRKALTAALMASEGRHRIRSELVALLMFSDLLPPEKLETVLTNRIAELERIQTELSEPQGVGPGQRFLRDLGLALSAVELLFLRQNVPILLDDLSKSRKDPETNAPDPVVGTSH